MQQTSVQNQQGTEQTPQVVSIPWNAEYLTGESCWDEQAAGARCSEQPANSTNKNIINLWNSSPPWESTWGAAENETGKN